LNCNPKTSFVKNTSYNLKEVAKVLMEQYSRKKKKDMTALLKINFKDTRRFGLKFWPAKKLTRKQKDVYVKVARRKVYKQSFFCRKLFQQKKLSLFYGKLNFQSYQTAFKKLNTLKGNRLKNFFINMEKRLDVLCFRMKFFSTLGTARQMILHQKVLLNGQPAKFSQINVKIGDIISMDSSLFPVVTKSIHNYLKFINLLIKRKTFIYNISPTKKNFAPNIFPKANLESFRESFIPNSLANNFAKRSTVAALWKKQLFGYEGNNKIKESSIFNHLFFDKKVSIPLQKNYFFNTNLEKIIIKKNKWLQIQQTKSEIEKKTKKNRINLKFSRLNAYKLPHLEINYATLTAILLPYQPNFGFSPKFSETLSYTLLRQRN